MIHRHVWEFKSLNKCKRYNFNDQRGEGLPVEMYTLVLYVCERCGKVTTITLEGDWAESDLVGSKP